MVGQGSAAVFCAHVYPTGQLTGIKTSTQKLSEENCNCHKNICLDVPLMITMNITTSCLRTLALRQTGFLHCI